MARHYIAQGSTGAAQGTTQALAAIQTSYYLTEMKDHAAKEIAALADIVIKMVSNRHSRRPSAANREDQCRRT